MRMHRAWLAAASLVVGLPAAAAAQAQQGQALAVVYRFIAGNEIGVQRGGQGATTVAQMGDVLMDQDNVGTGPSTRAAIRFTDDGTLLRMDVNSQVRIMRGTPADRAAGVKTIAMEAGTLWAKVTRGPARSFQVQTPAGVAAVKGTEFIITVGPNGTTITTLEGVVEFFNSGGTVDVGEGQTLNIPGNNAIGQPRDTQDSDTANLGSIINTEVGNGGDGDNVEVEIHLFDAEQREKVIFLVVPRIDVRAILGGGGN